MMSPDARVHYYSIYTLLPLKYYSCIHAYQVADVLQRTTGDGADILIMHE